MSGRAFGTRFTFLWPSAKIAVMGGKQIAGVMSIVRRGQAARKGEPFDEEADAMIRAAVEDAQERGSVALEASGAISDDGHHRSARYAHGSRHLPLGGSQQARRGHRRIRSVPAVSFTDPARRQPRRDRAAHPAQRP